MSNLPRHQTQTQRAHRAMLPVAILALWILVALTLVVRATPDCTSAATPAASIAQALTDALQRAAGR